MISFFVSGGIMYEITQLNSISIPFGLIVSLIIGYLSFKKMTDKILNG
jgi:hypothetical protein